MSKQSNGHLVLLLRSGRTAWDDEGRLQGKTDLPLSESGRAAFVASLSSVIGQDDIAYTVVHHGPDEATKESAALLADRLGAKLKEASGFRGIDLGLWDGLLESDLTERYPRAVKQWHEDPAHVTPPEGETIAELTDRLLTVLSKVIEKAGERPVAIVLRPIAYGLLINLLAGRESADLWQTVHEGSLSERMVLTVQEVKDLIDVHRASV